MTSSQRLAAMGTSRRAIRHHYDLSDDFFRIWLGPDMVYSCGWWEAGDDRDSLAQAQHRKLDFFADRLGGRAHPEPRPGRVRSPPERARSVLPAAELGRP